MIRQNDNRDFAVIGLGRFGASLALRLMERGCHVLGIDRDETIVQRLAGQLTQAAALDATDEEALSEVDIGGFGTVIVAIGKRFDCNLMTTVALKSLGVPHVICKALTERERHVLLRVGADRVVLPEAEAGQRLAQELIAPNLLDRLALAGDHSVTELRVPRTLVGMTLHRADLRRRLGITVLAVERGASLTVSPAADYVLSGDDRLVVLGTNQQIASLTHLR